ncbi:twin transmembrane helix small protein [Chitinimonas sp. PSY-7]|uniref:twin transmembrane helix small protein n=1 Tax=Chitinimonas sp. PSY-7 TaxID=3459088 RepID=UPI004040175B
MKIIIVLLIIGILIALGSALFALIKHKGSSDRTVKALTIRVAMSVGLFLLLMLAAKFGYIQPHGVYGG